MINPQWFKLSMSRTNFHGPNDFWATEVWLYSVFFSKTYLVSLIKVVSLRPFQWASTRSILVQRWVNFQCSHKGFVQKDKKKSQVITGTSFITFKKPTDLDLHCLPFSMWIYINNLDQVIWLAENLTWVWHLNLCSMARVKLKQW